MKHFRLLLTLLTLIAGGVSVSAQTWTPPTIQGEDPVSGETYKIYNVGAGKFLSMGKAWFGWTTTAILDDTGVDFLLEGDYTISCTLKNTSNSKYLFTSGNNITGDAMHVDGGTPTNYAFTKMTNGYYHAHDAGGDATSTCWGYNPSFHATGVVAHADASSTGWMCDWVFLKDTSVIPIYIARLNLYNEYLKAAAEGANTDEAATIYNNANATVDEINAATTALHTTRYEHKLAIASNDNPQDITEFILTNADFSNGTINGWETNYVSGQQAQNIGYQGNSSYTNENVTISQFIEAWRPGATLGDGYLRQTVSGLPEGKYTLEADGIATWQDDDSRVITGAYLYINAAGVDYKTSMSTKNGKPEHFTAQFLSPGDVDVTFGLKTESATCNWLCADNFKVKFYGIDLSPYATLLAEAVAEAQAVDATTIPSAAYQALNSAVNANNKEWSTSAEYTAAIAAIQQATTDAKALQPNYSRYNSVKAAALAIAENTNTGDADAAVNAATTNEGIDAAVATLRSAFLTELPNVTIPTEPGYIDVTSALVDNASVRQNTDYWTKEGTPNGNNSFGKCAYDECEFWGANFKFYQTIALSAGTWEFGVTGFHRAGDHSTYFYAGEDKVLIPGVASDVVNSMEGAKTYFDNGNGKVALKFALEDNKNIEIGIHNQDTQTDMWTIFRDFTLKYYGSSIDLTPYKEALQQAIAAADALEGTIPAAAFTQLTTVVNENNKEYTNVADYQAAKAAIDEAIATAKSLQTPYNRYQAVKTAVLALDDDTEAFTGEATVSTTDADEAVEAATTVEAIESAIALLRADANTFLDAIAVNEGKKIDVTNVWVTNPGFEEGNVNGWTNSGALTAGAQSNKAFDNTQGNYYAERWHTDGTVNLNQTLTGLPAGNYEISAYLYTDTPDGVLYANNAQTAFSTSNNYNVTVYIDDNGSITFGASCTLTTSTWICMDEFKIEYVSIDHSRYNSVKEAVQAISTDIDIAEAEALNAAAKNTEAIENAVKALRTALLAYLPTAEIAEGEYIDLTNALIDNPTVRQNTDYWTAEGTPNGGYSWGKVSNEECEFYYQNFDFYQTLTLCKGTFEFGVTGFHRAGNHNTHFYAGEDKILIPGVESSVVNTMAEAKEYFDNGNGKVALKFALENESNTLKIGIVNNDTETDKWTIFRDFTLKYFGSQVDLSIYEEAWQEAVAAANAAIEANPNVTGEELAAVNAAKADTPDQTLESYQTKTNALNDATQALIAAAPAYNTFADYKTFVDEITLPYADQAKKPTTDGIEDPTTAAEAKAKAEAILVSLRPYFESNALAEGVEGAVNMTDKIGQANAPATAEEITAWTITDNSEESNPTVRSNEPFTQGDGTSGGPYYDGGDLYYVTYEANYKQEIELPAGKYLLTVTARASQDCKKFELYAGENTVEMTKIGAAVGTGVFDRGWNDEFVEFTLSEKQTVEIGVNIEQDKQYNWYSFSRFRLVQLEGDADQAGDVNGDTKVDVADITAMVNIIVANGYEKVADLDGDNDVDTEDVKALVNLVLGEE